MPELPEVENLRMGLAKNILNQKILNVEIRKPKLVSGKGTLRKISIKKKTQFIKGVVGEKFIGVERRAKNLIFKLTHGKILIAHLKMSGQFAYSPFEALLARRSLGVAWAKKGKAIIGGHPIELSETELPNKHSHIIFKLNNGVLYYNDIRMFGYVLYYPNLKAFEAENHFAMYGVEPLSGEFTPKYFFESLKNKKGKIKAVLMDQRIVTGLGNIRSEEHTSE